MMEKFSVKDDVILAQKIILGSYINCCSDLSYHHDSFIYRFSNEEIIDYQKYLVNKQKVLAITASGDQILNSILEGSKDITSCDISRFPKYYFELKKAAILSLSKKEFLDFFISDYKDKDDLYDAIREKLDTNSTEFWDGVFSFFDGIDIYSSSLFSNEILIESRIKEKNKYLQDDNYDKLKNNLQDSKIKHHVGNIRDIVSSLDDEYDLINLSSIFYYGFDGCDDYKSFLDSLPLSDNGKAITYLYGIRSDLINNFSENNYFFDQFENSREGVMVYKK